MADVSALKITAYVAGAGNFQAHALDGRCVGFWLISNDPALVSAWGVAVTDANPAVGTLNPGVPVASLYADGKISWKFLDDSFQGKTIYVAPAGVNTVWVFEQLYAGPHGN